MKTLHVPMEKKEFDIFLKAKGKLSWIDFLREAKDAREILKKNKGETK